MAGGFKQFLLRGNVVDLAVGVVVGAAFGGVVTAFTKDLLTPLIAAVAGKPDFSAIQFTVNNSKFLVGDFVNAIVSFLIIATAVYYLVVLPVNALVSRARKEPPADPTTKKCPECLSEIAIRRETLRLLHQRAVRPDGVFSGRYATVVISRHFSTLIDEFRPLSRASDRPHHPQARSGPGRCPPGMRRGPQIRICQRVRQPVLGEAGGR